MGNCWSCGEPRVHEGDEFCRNCGQAYGADPSAVPPAAPTAFPPAAFPPAAFPPAVPPAVGMPTMPPPSPMPPVPPSTAPPAPPAAAGWPTAAPPPVGPGGYPMGPPPVSPPTYVPPQGRRAPVGRIVAIGGLVLALVAAGFVGWHFFWPRGGAGSPEGAAEKLMLSAADQDPAGAIGVLSPGEVEGLDDVYDEAFERAEDEKLVEGDGITDALDIELSDLEFDVEELGDDLARVTLTGGEYDVSWDPEKLPERLEFLSEESEADSESGDLEDVFDGEEPSVMTVKIDGRWYVTLLGTVADYAYQDAVDDSDEELAEPDWDAAAEDVDPIVGDDPEEVIENLVEAINGDDVEDLLANLPEDLVKPLRPYAGVVQEFLDDNGLADDEIGVEVTVTDLDLSTEELDDGRVKVVIERGTFSGSAFEIADGYTEEGSGSINVAGDCIEIYEAGSLQDETCLGEEETVEDLGLDEIFFVVREVDDGYQLDPAATWTEYASIAVENLSDDLIDMIVEEIEEEV